MRRLAAVATMAVLLGACGGSGGGDDAGAEDAARRAAQMWLSALWRNDIDAACPNMPRKPPTPPLGGCGEWVHEVYVQTLNPDGVPLTSLVVGRVEVTGEGKNRKAMVSSDNVMVNGHRLSDTLGRPTTGRLVAEYIFSELEPGMWWYSSHSITWK